MCLNTHLVPFAPCLGGWGKRNFEPSEIITMALHKGPLLLLYKVRLQIVACQWSFYALYVDSLALDLNSLS
jgi:hypothetical protein